MWWNTLALRGAVTTPTKLRQAGQHLRRMGDDALRLVGLQLLAARPSAISSGSSGRAVSMVSTNSR
jgi:hypothetical protein